GSARRLHAALATVDDRDVDEPGEAVCRQEVIDLHIAWQASTIHVGEVASRTRDDVNIHSGDLLQYSEHELSAGTGAHADIHHRSLTRGERVNPVRQLAVTGGVHR